MKTTKNFIGIDIASEDFTTSIFRFFPPKADLPLAEKEAIETKEKVSNNIDGFQSLENWFKDNQVTQEDSIICMEATGVYAESLCYHLYSKGYRVVVESPNKVKKAFDNLSKNDKVDSKQIAEYAYRFYDKLKLWQPNEETLEKIRILLTTREQLTNQIIANTNVLKAFKRKVVQNQFANQVLVETIESLKENIKAIESEIQKLIDSNSTFKHIVSLIDSVPGVGLLLSANLLVMTNAFSTNVSPNELCSFFGIAPHEHSSGKSVKRNFHSTGLGNHTIRKLLHLASRSVAQHVDYFKKYYLRKLYQGKPKRLIYNNISNKLIKIICAVVESKTQYIPNYFSVNPLFLKSA